MRRQDSLTVGSGWRAAAAARLASIDPAAARIAGIDTVLAAPARSSRVVIEDENLGGCAGISLTTLSEIEAEIEAIQKKLQNEQRSIDEAKSLRLNRRQLNDALVQAKRSTEREAADETSSFFVTGINLDASPPEPVQAPKRELYPNYQREVKIAHDAALEKQIARLKGGGTEPLGKKTAQTRSRGNAETASETSARVSSLTRR
jgi:hypothetical protein